MKSTLGKCLLGLGLLLAFVWVFTPNTARAADVGCSVLDGSPPLMSITIPGYVTCANSTANPDGVCDITVPSGTVLTGTFHNNPSVGVSYSFIAESWPGGTAQPVPPLTPYPADRVHTSDSITSASAFSMGVDRNCVEDPSPEHGGSVYVGITVTTPAPTVTLSASPNPVNSGSPTTLTWTSTNATSCTATAGAGFSTGTATSGSDASTALTTQTAFSISCSGAGGTASRSVTVDISGAPTAPTCSANPASVTTGQNTTITATGGSGGTSPFYTWSTGGGGACATGGTCTTSYSTTGTKVVTVTRNGLSGTCSVTVSSTPDTVPTGAFTNTASCAATGWADDVDTTTPRPVRVYSDGGLVSTVTAGTTGCSGSACTFSSNLTGLVSTGVAHAITGTVQGDDTVWYPLSNPMSMTCTPTVTCSGVSAGQTGTSYTFTGSGGSTYTWGVSPTIGFTPTGATGSGATVTKSFSTTGTKTITFTSGAQSGTCSVDISASAPPLGADLRINGSDGPITILYGALPVLSWSSSGASRCDTTGATPADTDWASSGDVGLSGSRTVSPLVRTTYPLRCVRFTPVGTVSDSVVARVTPECLPAGQTVTTGQTATLTARGGDGTYAWTATGGTPTSGSGASLGVSYATTGTKTVSLLSDSLTTSCTVTVSSAPPTTGTVIVNSNVATTWTLTRPSPDAPYTQTIPTTTTTLNNQTVGIHTLGNLEALSEYGTPTISPASSQSLSAGGVITFNITYPPLPSASVDIEANGSDGPVEVAEGGSVLLTWSSSNINTGTCVASDGWSGSQSDSNSSGVSSGAVNSDTTFTITCESATGAKGTEVSDSVDVTTRLPECRDNVNNDTEDTIIDFTDGDPGCTDADDDDETNGTPECSDSVDNDGDTLTDFAGGDPGCLSASDDTEDDIEITECSDGFDNDGDGEIDDADAQCTGPDDTSERATPDIREI